LYSCNLTYASIRWVSGPWGEIPQGHLPVVRGQSLGSMSVQVVGTDAVVSLAKERLSDMFDEDDSGETGADDE